MGKIGVLTMIIKNIRRLVLSQRSFHVNKNSILGVGVYEVVVNLTYSPMPRAKTIVPGRPRDHLWSKIAHLHFDLDADVFAALSNSVAQVTECVIVVAICVGHYDEFAPS